MPLNGLLHVHYAQYVSGTFMPIIKSSRLYACYYRLWCALPWLLVVGGQVQSSRLCVRDEGCYSTEFSRTKFHENSSRGNRIVPRGHADRQTDTQRETDGQTDMMKLIVAFRNFANGPNNYWCDSESAQKLEAYLSEKRQKNISFISNGSQNIPHFVSSIHDEKRRR
jgi:hypothetical protein